MNKLLKFLILPVLALLIGAISCSNKNANASKEDSVDQVTPVSGVEYLSTDLFKKNIFDFSVEKEWKYKGKTACLIDFYADWCGPCKRVAPIMDELSAQYKGKVKFYKVNIDKEGELASVFGVKSIPSILFVPLKGQPQMTTGAYPKEDYVKMIEEIIAVKK